MDVPADRVHHVLGTRERDGSVVLARDELCRPVAFAFLDGSVDDESRFLEKIDAYGITLPCSETAVVKLTVLDGFPWRQLHGGRPDACPQCKSLSALPGSASIAKPRCCSTQSTRPASSVL
jgi:predicted Zn-ribbon and HTH transcriptional regulator